MAQNRATDEIESESAANAQVLTTDRSPPLDRTRVNPTSNASLPFVLGQQLGIKSRARIPNCRPVDWKLNTGSEHSPGSRDKHGYVERLLSPDRERRAKTDTLLRLAGLDERDVVADVGCGAGYYTVAMARALTNGRVIALDVDDEMVEICRRRIIKEQIANAEARKCGDYEFGLPGASIDGALLSCVVHHAENQGRFLAAVRQMLKTAGWCAVLEWHPRATSDGPPLSRRIEPGELRRIATEAGFTVNVTHDLSDELYLVTLRNG